MLNPLFFGRGALEPGIGLGIVLFLVWLSVGIWAYRDMRHRSRSGGPAILVLLMVFLLPVAGLVIYLLLRPRETLMARYDQSLRQEALLQQIESGTSCPGCARPVAANWLVCPECHVTLRRPCQHCGTPLEMHWLLCPVCAHMVDVPESVQAGTVAAGSGSE